MAFFYVHVQVSLKYHKSGIILQLENENDRLKCLSCQDSARFYLECRHQNNNPLVHIYAIERGERVIL